jgi:acetate kinase
LLPGKRRSNEKTGPDHDAICGCRRCPAQAFLGIEIEEKNNAANEGVISAAASRVGVRVIRTDEEQVIAKTVCSVLGLGSKKEN